MPKSYTKKVLVTGASGLLGLELIRYLNNEGFDAIGTYFSHNNSERNE